ncbi:MAG: bifunctional lysine ketoglutarate reductase /saccharopine dehydrogenase family protein [bacterium]
MSKTLGIRREDKNIWERRVPVIPAHLGPLLADGALQAVVQPFPRRVFTDAEYVEVGAVLDEDLSGCDVVFAVKEIPAELFQPSRAYVFFAHVIKAQPYNMPMLRRLLELGCTLIDYEKIADEQGRRLVFFSRQAGQAGMIDSLHLLGRRLALEGLDTPFTAVEMAYAYPSLRHTREALRDVGARIVAGGLPPSLTPLVVGFAGYGNVSQGAQDIFAELPAERVTPEALLAGELPKAALVWVEFSESDMVERVDGGPFALQEYYRRPEEYQGRFARFLPHLHLLMNGIYWEEQYPRLVTNEDLARLWAPAEPPRLRVIGDVSCDLEGSIQCTVKTTMPDAPSYVFDPATGEIAMGIEGAGPVVMAVDNLPAELARESSVLFSESLRPFVPAIVRAERSVPFERFDVPDPVRRAVIAYNGELTPDFTYLKDAI